MNNIMVAVESDAIIPGVRLPVENPDKLAKLESKLRKRLDATPEQEHERKLHKAALSQYLRSKVAGHFTALTCVNSVMKALLSDTCGYFMNFNDGNKLLSPENRVVFGAVAPTVRGIVLDVYSSIAAMQGNQFTFNELRMKTVIWFIKRRHSDKPAPKHPFEFSLQCIEDMDNLDPFLE